MEENKQNNAKPTIDKEYLKKLAEKIKAEKARKESLNRQADPVQAQPSISSISSKYLSEDDDEEMASEKTAIIDLSAFSGHSSDARLTIVDGKDAGKNIEITKDEILAGRSLDNDFVISDISVSRKHFKITKENNRFIVKDLGSGNGIKINGSKTTSAELADGDIISVGARQIKFEILNPELKKTKSQPQPKQPRQTLQINETDDSDEIPVKKGGSPLIWIVVAAAVVVIGAAAYFVLGNKSSESANKPEIQHEFGEQEKLAIEKLINAKDLKNAEKAVFAANEKTSGDNPYKQWLNEQLVLIGKEKTNQITFENGKNALIQKNQEGEKLLKSIPASSIFYKDAQNLLMSAPKKEAPKTEPKAEPKKEEPKAEPKKAEPKKAEKKAEQKKAEPKKTEPKVEPNQEEAKAEPKAEPKKEEPKAEPKVEPKKEEPKTEPKPEPKKEEPKAEPKPEPKKEEPKAEPKKEEPKKEVKKAEPKPAKKKSTMSEEEAKKLYMEANAMKDENPEKAKETLKKILDSVDPESKRYKKAKELLEKL